MTINVWFDAEKGIYNIRYNGRNYQRHSYVAAKELIDGFLCNMVAFEKYAA